jgi:coniferyl-aldehyde dehydrogenase
MSHNGSSQQNNLTASHQQFANHQIQNAKDIFQLQRDAYTQLPYPSESLRKQQLKALKQALLKHKDKLAKAIAADFGHRSVDETLLADIMPSLKSIDYCLKHLANWMSDDKRSVAMLFQPAKAKIVYQPLGVVGVMSPWNYPVYMTIGPLAAAIAAGNRVMIKPSEYCPYANRVLNEILQQAFTKDEVFVIEGDAQVAQAFSELAFDHILFTGSTAVGKKVMAAASANLTPVTLELGGKSPAIIAEDVSPAFAVERLLYGKCLNAGQTCVAPDYILCPEDKKDAIITEFKRQFNLLYPDLSNGDYTSIIHDAHYQRLQQLLDDATAKGAKVISASDQLSAAQSVGQLRCMPLQLVENVDRSMKIMQQEIFGPLLPIMTYSELEQAIAMVNQSPRPLALYIMSHDKKIQQEILTNTHAGGVCINDSVVHVAQDDLPFGGVGKSGMGRYHGKEGFYTFSAAKSVFQRGRFNSAKPAYPPYNKLIHKVLYRWFIK